MVRRAPAAGGARLPAGREGAGAIAESLEALRGPIEETVAALDRRADVGRQLPHRADSIEINQRLARRVVEAHEQWLEEAQAALRARR